jgi:thymidylate synthase
MNNLDKTYTDLLKDILENGTRKGDRTGTGTISVFGRQIRHKMSEGFPLLTTKKMYMKGIVTELIWFLRGDTNIKYLVDNDCNIWNGDAWKNYQHKASKEDFLKDGVLRYEEFVNKIKTDQMFASKWGDLGPVYGKQWRSWKSASLKEQWGYGEIEGHPTGGKQYSKFNTNVHIDQIANLINDLKTNPDSRRLMVNAWNVGELDSMVLPPCHYGFQVYTRELSREERYNLMPSITGHSNENIESRKNINNFEGNDPGVSYHEEWLDSYNIPTRAISLMWNQRSCDTFLGLPFNIASYGLLLEIIAKVVNMVPEELIGNLGDTHLYSNHIEQAKEQIGRELSITERLDLASKKYQVFDPFDFYRVDHEEIDKLYPVERRTREPFNLPHIKYMKNDSFFKSLGEDLSLLNQLEINDFVIENYKSHSTIKAPLSN